METNNESGHALAGLDPKNNTATQQSPHLNASDEKVDDNGSFISSREKTLTPIQELKSKISFARLMVRDGHVIKRRGRNMMACCPFHDDRTPSFSIYEDDERAKCWGCEWYGDAYQYEMDYRKVDFYKAFQRLEKKLKHIQKTSEPVPSTKAPRDRKLEMLHHAQQTQKRKEASQYLANNPWLCENIASKRNWQSTTIKALADDGSLGWCQGALAFNYSTGMKLRDWPHRQFLWEFGGPSLWRAGLIDSAKKVMVCEGETDAITLVDLGLEHDHKLAVVALPSASSIPSDITTILQGREVVLCLDNDEAGHRATDNLCDLLDPVCSLLTILDLKEVTCE